MHGPEGMAADEQESPPWPALGRLLRLTREQAGLSQEEAAQRAKISRVTLGKYEDGWATKLDELRRLADAIGVSIDEKVGVTQLQDVTNSLVKHVSQRRLHAADAIEESQRALTDLGRQREALFKGLTEQQELAYEVARRILETDAALDAVRIEQITANTMENIDNSRSKAVQAGLAELKTARDAIASLRASHGGHHMVGSLAELLRPYMSAEAIAAMFAINAMKPETRRAALGDVLQIGLAESRFTGRRTLPPDPEPDPEPESEGDKKT